MAELDVPQGALRSGNEGKLLAVQRLREDITAGTLAPGQRLVEADLSERYGVTRNSARLAIDVLAADRLVERIANRGARVRTISTREAVEIMECRMVLDGLLCAKAAVTGSDPDLARLEANRERMREAVSKGELLEYSNLIQRHHAIVAECANHSTATMLAERLQAQIVRQQYQLSLRPQRARESLLELERVVSSIAAGDAEAAELAGRAHILGVIAALLDEASALAQRSGSGVA